MAGGREKVNWFEITEDDVARRRAALTTLLDTMDVPEQRKDFTSRNVSWLNRNLAVRNSSHPMFQTANDLVVWLCRWHNAQA